jgi:hypothetical protein
MDEIAGRGADAGQFWKANAGAAARMSVQPNHDVLDHGGCHVWSSSSKDLIKAIDSKAGSTATTPEQITSAPWQSNLMVVNSIGVN